MRPVRLFLFCLLPNLCFAGAWLQPKGGGIAVISATYFSGNEYFNEAGDKKPQARFRKQEASAYGEYGISENWTAGANLFLNHVDQSGASNTGLADSEFFVRRQLYRTDRLVVSAQPSIKLPSHYRSKTLPLGGSKSTDMELSMLAGYTTPILTENDYIDARLGYRTRTRGLSNLIRMEVAVGMHIAPKWLLIPAVRSTVSEAPAPVGSYREDGEQDYDLLKTELSLLYNITDTQWLQASIYDHTQGALAGAGQGISLGYGVHF